MVKDSERVIECLKCEYWDLCEKLVRFPADNPDGTCATRSLFKFGDKDDGKRRRYGMLKL